MQITDAFPTNYAANVVACKLWGLVGSPTEYILASAVYNELVRCYHAWKCWVYSNDEYLQAVSDGGAVGLEFALVPQWRVSQVGDVDLAIFIPGFSRRRPVVAVETDGHQFHERTIDQASNDRRRDRILQRYRIPVYRFTGTDVVRGSNKCTTEIVDLINERAQLSFWRTH